MFEMYHSVIIQATLCLNIKRIGGKISNYESFWALFNNC